MQRYTILFITVNALQVSGGFSTHRQEIKSVHTASGICHACFLLPLAWVSWITIIYIVYFTISFLVHCFGIIAIFREFAPMLLKRTAIT